ncbi:MAG: ZIP family metal transporter [Acidobacteria bacterium]|nr:ZIP family metal transporter [Acidobacteriota bacterium]
MDQNVLQLVLFGLLAALANVLGGLVIFPSKLHSTYKNALKYLLALSAGFMLAVTLFEIFPRSIELWNTVPHSHNGEHGLTDIFFWPILLLLGGYLATQFFEHTIAPHFHLGAEVHSDHVISTGSAYAGIGGLLIHTFFDGVSIAAASQIDQNVGLLVFIAIFLHKFPEGFTVGSMMVSAGKGFREVLTATSIIGATTLLGVLTFYAVGLSIQGSVAYAMPFAAGVMLYVAASDLIPEVNHHGGKKPLVSLSVFAGVAMFFCLHFIVHELFGH